MKQLFFFSLISMLICSCSSASAQSYIPGKIFKESDTLKGFIREQNDKKNSTECLFKNSLSEKPIVFSAKQIKGYALENGKIYKSYLIKTDTVSQVVFLQVLTRGELNSYFLRQRNGNDRFFLEKNDKIIEISGGQEIEVQGTMRYYKGNYQELLKLFLEDCEKKKYNLSKLRYDRKDISNVAWQYNQCRNSDLYHYVPQRSRLVRGVKAGYYPVIVNAAPNIPAYYLPPVNQTDMGLQLGLFVSDQILDVDKKLFFQFEAQFIYFHFSNLLNSEIKVSMLNLPASFKYYFISGKFSPYIEGGAYLSLNLSHSSSNKSFDIGNISSNDSGLLSGAGVKWNVAKNEFSLGYRYQRLFLNKSNSTYYFQVDAHMITLSFGFLKK